MAGDKFMPELHLRQLGFTYGACGPFTKHCEKIQKFREGCNLKHIYKKELVKACFSHDTAYCDRIDLGKRTASDKLLRESL